MKYEQIYNELISRSFNRDLVGYTEKHHIVPRCLGGADDNSNICILTAREHYIAHALLCKIHRGHAGLMFAFHMMNVSSKNHSRHYNSKLYDLMRSKVVLGLTDSHRKALSNSLKGRTFSEETRIKISKNRKGILASEETKQKMSKSQSKRNRPNSEYESRRGIKRKDIYKEHMKSKMKGIHLGKKKYNDGSKEYLCFSSSARDDWVLGRLKKSV